MYSTYSAYNSYTGLYGYGQNTRYYPGNPQSPVSMRLPYRPEAQQTTIHHGVSWEMKPLPGQLPTIPSITPNQHIWCIALAVPLGHRLVSD